MKEAEEDGFVTPEVGVWSEGKYDLLGHYCNLFATGMKNRWGRRVYIDLFAGAGKARIKSSNKVVLASPLIAMEVTDQFDQYIFCDESEVNMEALRARVGVLHPGVDVRYVVGDCNRKIEEITAHIPKHSPASTVLSFCFVDPFSLRVEFETIRFLSRYFMDFLILLALGMDANRNESNYMREDNDRIDKFLGIDDWRSHWRTLQPKGVSFQRFLAKAFSQQMILLKYRDESIKTMLEVRSKDKNLPLYHLGFFPRLH